MNCIEIAEWTADKFSYYRNSFPNKSEGAIVKFISTILYKYKVVSKDFDELAISNLPYLDTFFKLLVLFIDIEIEKERRATMDTSIKLQVTIFV